MRFGWKERLQCCFNILQCWTDHADTKNVNAVLAVNGMCQLFFGQRYLLRMILPQRIQRHVVRIGLHRSEELLRIELLKPSGETPPSIERGRKVKRLSAKRLYRHCRSGCVGTALEHPETYLPCTDSRHASFSL